MLPFVSGATRQVLQYATLDKEGDKLTPGRKTSHQNHLTINYDLLDLDVHSVYQPKSEERMLDDVLKARGMG